MVDEQLLEALRLAERLGRELAAEEQGEHAVGEAGRRDAEDQLVVDDRHGAGDIVAGDVPVLELAELAGGEADAGALLHAVDGGAQGLGVAQLDAHGREQAEAVDREAGLDVEAEGGEAVDRELALQPRRGSR
ncbi:hypothetical protein [Nannocystis sp.]|uniref:hypothetical protein n=1 Tax=Nannocystis sp. TaxID=1962667 RepID=UPI0025E87F33|nr:hypothetical protein [Nannocystis sp.]MBK7829969.1 hypothetical protein [Nannocystis sp.]